MVDVGFTPLLDRSPRTHATPPPTGRTARGTAARVPAMFGPPASGSRGAAFPPW
ncbi:MAG: hypothetical protein AVDCRST_MAG70-2085 [uncultured Thermomicrobiales bacterium]|uniref:Uncharacterized protein n=1 Tax=uncultured Thermomicrobiales bacterium TaxID=1645740 RepID=A0A6J4V2E5_9BACT|nr:MAG: hypothetical protein AVDCRST_MAG70-2085 [uncultured Thermomicrobiales bacterium]